MKSACPICAVRIPKDTFVCPICGAALNFDAQRQIFQFYGVICNNCGYQNDSSSLRKCQRCSQRFSITCPRCGITLPLTQHYCASCRLPIRDFWELESEKQMAVLSRKKRRREKGERFVRYIWFVFSLLAFYSSVQTYYHRNYHWAFGYLALGILLFCAFLLDLLGSHEKLQPKAKKPGTKKYGA